MAIHAVAPTKQSTNPEVRIPHATDPHTATVSATAFAQREARQLAAGSTPQVPSKANMRQCTMRQCTMPRCCNSVLRSPCPTEPCAAVICSATADVRWMTPSRQSPLVSGRNARGTLPSTPPCWWRRSRRALAPHAREVPTRPPEPPVGAVGAKTQVSAWHPWRPAQMRARWGAPAR